MNDLTIKEEFHDKIYKTFCIDGLSVKEMNEILSDNNALKNVMEKHGMWRTYDLWRNGIGISGIRHVGGHLFVTIGKSCD